MRIGLGSKLFFGVVIISTARLHAADLSCSSPTSISSPAVYDNVSVHNGCVLTVDSTLTVNNDMTIEPGGVVTHSVRYEPGLNLQVTGILSVQGGGSIDTTGKGLLSGVGAAPGYAGESYDPATGLIVAGAKSDGVFIAGASYGGVGSSTATATTNPIYGSVTAPDQLGSGGGGVNPGFGNGGGLIKITAGTLAVNGSIVADGAFNNGGGGGSGGSIRIDAGTVSGTGTIRARGGVSLGYGCGGGGRVVLSYDTLTLPEASILAPGGFYYGDHYVGSPGAVYLKDHAQALGDLIFDNGGFPPDSPTPWPSSVTSLRRLVLRGNARIDLSAAASLTIAQSMELESGSQFTVASGTTLTISNPSDFDLIVRSGAIFNLESGSTLAADRVRVSGGIFNARRDMAFPNGSDFELSGNGVLNILNNRTFSIGSFTESNFISGTVNVPAGSRLDIAANAATIGNGVVLVKDGAFGASDTIGALTVQSSGLVTHSLRYEPGLNLQVTGTLTVQGGGSIDASAKGLLAGVGAAPGYAGESYDPTTGLIVAGAKSDGAFIAGASHGGVGPSTATATTNPIYGSVTAPNQLGSGGGGTNPGYGSGGGLIKITAGTLVVHGSILADGGFHNGGGGGSGGSIRIDASTVSGTGAIKARGGVSLGYGCGGGGRVAVAYDTLTLPEANIAAPGGFYFGDHYVGSPGTVYLKDHAQALGDLVFDNGGFPPDIPTPWPSSVTSLRRLVLQGNARIDLSAAAAASLTIAQSMELESGSQFTVASGTTLTISNPSDFDLIVRSGAIFNLESGSTLAADRVRVSGGIFNARRDMAFPNGSDFELSGNGVLNILNNRTFSIGSFTESNFIWGTVNVSAGSRLDIAANAATIGSGVVLVKDGAFGASDTIGALTVQSSGLVTHSLRYEPGLNLQVTGTLTVQGGGSIDASAKGLLAGVGSAPGYAGESYDPTTGLIVAGAKSDGVFIAGASYGGVGPSTATATTNPIYGSVTAPNQLGSGGGGTNPGYGSGGGLIKITAGTLVVHGSILADGGFHNGGGGGSGGSIRIDASTVSGTGTIKARGGVSLGYGCGGGGRVALSYDTLALPEANIAAPGGFYFGDHYIGSPGTVYLKDHAQALGDLVFDNGGFPPDIPTPWPSSVTSLRRLVLRGNARIDLSAAVAASLTIAQSMELESGSQFTVASGTTLTISNPSDFDLIVRSGAIFNLESGSTLAADRVRVSGGIFNARRDMAFPNGSDFELSGNGVLNILNNRTFSIGSFTESNFIWGTVNVSAGSRLDIAANAATIGNGVVLVKDGAFGASDTIGALAVQPGGIVTHSVRYEPGLNLQVTGTLAVQGGTIDVTGKGLLGGVGSAPGYAGESYDPATGLIVAGAKSDGSFIAGASYGGVSSSTATATTNPIYGSVTAPDQLGSGGGGVVTGSGNGGGLIKIAAGTLTVNGSILADGAFNNVGSGGSGGSIRIDASTVSGTGTIRASGGASNAYGSGGGGRVAVAYDTLTLAEANISAPGGFYFGDHYIGSPGTVYLKDHAQTLGDLVINNGNFASDVGTPLPPAANHFRAIRIRSKGRLDLAFALSPPVRTGTLLIDGAGSALSHAAGDARGLRLTVDSALTLTNGGSVRATGLGLAGGAAGGPFGDSGVTFAPDGVTLAAGSSSGSGGSHGGLGGGITPNATYGSAINPRQLGSGGARSAGIGAGGNGGGRLWVDAAVCNIPAGTAVAADGGAGTAGADPNFGQEGGGSGGSVKLDCGTINGDGAIIALGGSGGGINGHGGGGGRVVLRTNANNFTGSTAAAVASAGGPATGAGNGGQAGSFIVGDLVPPRVIAMTPAPGSTAIGGINQIVVTLSENLWAPTVSAAFVHLNGATTGSHTPSGVSFNTGDQKLTIDFAAPLPQDAYTLTLVSNEEPDGLCDNSINAVDGEYAGALPSGDGRSGGDFVAPFGVNTAPQVVDVVPDANALGVPEASNVTLTFNEPMLASSVNAATIRLFAGGSQVPATVALATSGLRATLDPLPVLSLNTLYTVDVTASAKDASGLGAVPFTSYFRTSSTPTGSATLPSVSDEAGGPAAQSRAGASVAPAGDVNGDAIQDWIAGAPSYASGPVESGGALVYLGSASAAQLTAPDIIFTGVGAHDRAGVSVAGDFDFNGDGIRDFVIGAEQVNRTLDDDPGAGCNAGQPCGNGKVYVIFFNPSDTTHYPNLANPAVPDVVSLSLVGQPGGIPGVVFSGAALGDQAGFAVAGGGTSTPGGGQDVVIGAPGANPGGRTDAGAAYVVFDNASLSGNVSLSRISSGLPDQVPGKAYLGESAGDSLGAGVGFGGDIIQGQTPGAGTVLLGAPNASAQRGRLIAPPGDPDTTPIIVDAVGNTHSGIQLRGTQPGEQLGYAVAAGGDALADGVPDLLIGAPTYDADIRTDAGRVIQTTQVIASGVYNADDVGATIAGVRWTGNAANDELGYAMAGVHDVTGDGYDDVVLGAPFVDPLVGGDPKTDAGAIYLIDGSPTTGFLGAQSIADVGGVIPGVRLIGTQPGEHAGASLAGTGDIDGNGDGDFIVGAPDKDVSGDPNAGTVYLVTDTEIAPVGGCGTSSPCLVADLANGAQISIPAGALASPVDIAVTGIVATGALPGPVPAGTLLLGAARYEPDGQAFSSPSTIAIPTRAAVEPQLTNLESLPVSRWTGASWIAAGFNGSVGSNPQYPTRKAVTASTGVARVYAVFLADVDNDGIRDERDNCPTSSNPSQSDVDADTIGDACDPCTDTDHDGFGNPGFPANTCTLDNCPLIANAAQTDGDGDGVGNVCDNCPSVANPSQDDADADNVGDACDTDPRLSVSNNVSQPHDFTTIQAAVNAATQSGTRIRISPGSGPYLEHVVVNRNLAFIFEGVDDASHTPVVVDGGSGIAFDVVTSAGGNVVSFDNLTIRGATGIRAAVSTAMEDLTFEQATSLAIDLNGGSHTLDRIKMGSTVASGIDTAAAVSLTLRTSRFEALTGTALRLGGSSTVQTVLIGGGSGDAVVMVSGGSLTLRNATIAGNGGRGIDNTPSAAVTVAHAIVQDDTGGDLVNVPCANVTWSNVKSTDCSGTGNDLHTTCALGPDYRQLGSSACLEFGPSPATFTGSPCVDLDGAVRLRDHDGNGIATIDPGAFEGVNAALTPGDITNLRFTSKTTLTWNADPSGLATAYHVYRDLRINLSYGNFGVCRDDLDPNPTDLVLADASTPTSGQCFTYVITASRPGAAAQPDREGTMGMAHCMERSNFSPCP